LALGSTDREDQCRSDPPDKRHSCPPSIVTRQSFRMVAELNKQDSTVSSLSIPEAYVGMLGTYRLEESDKFEEFMQALGVSPFMLLSDGVMRPVTVVSYVAQLSQFRLETRTALKKTELLFKIGEEFVEITGDGRRTTSKVTVEGNTMVHVQKGDSARGEKDTKIVRTFDPDKMHCVITITGAGGPEMRCIRSFKRIPDDYEEEGEMP